MSETKESARGGGSRTETVPNFGTGPHGATLRDGPLQAPPGTIDNKTVACLTLTKDDIQMVKCDVDTSVVAVELKIEGTIDFGVYEEEAHDPSEEPVKLTAPVLRAVPSQEKVVRESVVASSLTTKGIKFGRARRT